MLYIFKNSIRRFRLFMVLNATFNNISVISWRSVLLVEETGENHRPVASHWQTLSHNVVSSTPRHKWGSVVIGTDCKGSYKSNYYMITTMTAPQEIKILLIIIKMDLYDL